MARALLRFSRSVEGHNHRLDKETALTLLVLARYRHLPGLNTKALHAQSYGTTRQSTGSPHLQRRELPAAL
ncbi:hypothetical protein PTRG_11782 [Pyrenophora tritici-repentis Pt-1C-BFP]|uniref:Uncharacterized protein n=1 Tax=Pyrenophora tritici-repentis (strain Pt-1C-BFP) TaxID=426418 RepID=B2WP72_PYRTR|nr:uncharacterized protein PTRG_11782 [Pyrenophora tritici-repentis Pt-1C-BFP]EDU45938.1 hypothetical protein PTRG_11782 [Pyrenophora tritici-repentis Pt-1C-BFP]